MNLSNNTVLITGGASGIGLAIAQRFHGAGSQVIVVGRRADKLQQAQQQLPGLHYRVCDVAVAAERVALREWVQAEFPQTNVLVNNAGIQRRIGLSDTEPWEVSQSEIAINLEAPIHLSMLFVEHLRQQPTAAIINVSSGLAFTPMATAPIYSATKAALHSFTMSLRYQLAQTSIGVIEVVPPAVNTDLGGAGLHTFGADVDAFADSVMGRIANGEQEVGFGTSENRRLASREQNDAAFQQMNDRMRQMSGQ